MSITTCNVEFFKNLDNIMSKTTYVNFFLLQHYVKTDICVFLLATTLCQKRHLWTSSCYNAMSKATYRTLSAITLHLKNMKFYRRPKLTRMWQEMSKMISNVKFKKKFPQHDVKNDIYHFLNFSQDVVFDIRLWKFCCLIQVKFLTKLVSFIKI